MAALASSSVLDNSVLCGWFLANQATDYGDAYASWLLQLVFTNVLRTACRGGSLPIASCDADLAEAAWALTKGSGHGDSP